MNTTSSPHIRRFAALGFVIALAGGATACGKTVGHPAAQSDSKATTTSVAADGSTSRSTNRKGKAARGSNSEATGNSSASGSAAAASGGATGGATPASASSPSVAPPTTAAPAAPAADPAPPTVTPPEAPAIVSFTMPATVTCLGTGAIPIDAVWDTVHASEVTLQADGVAVMVGGAPSGTSTATFTCGADHTYELIAHGSGGAEAHATKTVRFHVLSPVNPGGITVPVTPLPTPTPGPIPGPFPGLLPGWLVPHIPVPSPVPGS